jgi:nicotinamidase-related amidase
MTIPEKGYQFPAEVAPLPSDVLLPKKHPSAFFGTPLASYLIDWAWIP